MNRKPQWRGRVGGASVASADEMERVRGK
jgi:hypothetical protein